MKSSGSVQWSSQSVNHHVRHPETALVVWPCNEKRRHERCKASHNNEGGRKGPRGRSRLRWMDRVRSDLKQHQLDPKLARREQRRTEKGNHGDRPRTGIRSAKVNKGEQSGLYCLCYTGMANWLDTSRWWFNCVCV